MLKLDHNAELLQCAADVRTQPSSNALMREAQLIWQGVASTPEHLQKSFSAEERAHTLENALFSAGITVVLSCLKRSPTLGWTAGRVLGPALALPLLSDMSARANTVSSAMADTWQSDRNWAHNVATTRDQIGQFTSDFAINALASGLAESAGRSYFGLKTGPGLSKLPELSKESLMSNWQRHMSGEIIPYKFISPEGGGARQVDLYIPNNIKNPAELAQIGKSDAGLLIAQDGLKIDFGRLDKLQSPEHGLANLKADKNSIDYVAAFTHPFRFRVVPGVNLAAWHHDGGLIEPGGWFSPKPKFSDANFVSDVQSKLSDIFKPARTVLAGYSSGAILSNEVAAKLGPSKIDAVVSVASTVIGKEMPAQPGQFRLFVRDMGDPTLLQNGGAGGKAKILANLGHKAVLASVPENQISYGLSPYDSQDIFSKRHSTMPNTLMHSFALKDGTPVLSHIKTNTGTHTWTTAESIKSAPWFDNLLSNLEAPFGNIFSEPKSAAWEQVDLNQMVKEIVKGDLSRFSTT